MTNVYLDLVNGQWKEVNDSNFWIDKPLYHKLQALKLIQQKNWDGVIIIDGKERSGKSVLGMICGWYLSNGQLSLNNFAKGLDDAARKIATLPDKSVLILDEGSLVFASKDSNSSVQKRLIKLMDVVGQKNMVFIICLPCFFDLNKTIAVRRSLFLCHVYPDEQYNRGQYAFFGEKTKKKLYIFGKKNYDSYAFPESEFVGKYMDFEPPFYKEYLEIIKKQSLQETIDDAVGNSPVNEQEIVIKTEAMIYGWLHEHEKLTQKRLEEIKNQSTSTIKARLTLYKRLKEGNSSVLSSEIEV